MSQPGAGVRREIESVQRKIRGFCETEGHPPDRLIVKGRAVTCGRCYQAFSCPGCGRVYQEAGVAFLCPLGVRCATHIRPWEG